ncbi:MAG TPA: hypothetical protein DEA43_02140 [Candidatus Moranbacteria bacterium]|nr:hypothetical protein [Candidatus Moranbacteria bacterium]HBT45664.1 hypothetical protein [Candidatus Moranbacteria bacterium]
MSQTALNALFQNAAADGGLSPAAMQALNVNDIGAQIQAGLGVSVDDVLASEVVIVTMMPDDSGSIRFAGNTQFVRDGHNAVIDALKDSKQKNGILMHTRYLNGNVLFPYVNIDQAVRMDSSNYNPNLGTPLFDQTLVLLGTVLAKTQEFADNGMHCRSVTCLVTDGDDEHSTRADARMVRTVVSDMLQTENHIIAGLGIDDAPEECRSCGCKTLRETELTVNTCPKCGAGFRRTNFEKVFLEMGLLKEWILTPKNTPSDIRKAFQMFSQSAVRASQGAASFSQTAVGGFGN